jgi:hypothetical protein
LLASCQTMEQQTTEKYAWDASPTAPKGYPVQVYKGQLSDAQGHATTIPNGHYLQDGWGMSLITWIADDDTKPLPQQLELTWFSFAENKFYTGTFTLPRQQVATLFREGYYNKRKKETYDRFVIGIAPKGMVVVWLRGQNQVELARFQATETEVDWDDFYYKSVGGNSYGKADRARDIKDEQQKLNPEVQQQLKSGGLSSQQWDNYRSKYRWSIVFKDGDKLEDYSVKYWNGEQEKLPVNKQLLQDKNTAKPLPKELSLFIEKEKKVRFDIVFDEAELLGIFRDIKTNEVVDMVITAHDDGAGLALRYRQQDVPLKHCRIHVYSD